MIQVKTIKAKFIGYQSPLVVEFDGEKSGTVIVGDEVNEVGERSETWTSVFNKEIWQILEISKKTSTKSAKRLGVNSFVHLKKHKNITGVVVDSSNVGFNHWMVKWDRTGETVREYGGDLVVCSK